jgi:zinc transport system substrate-binding protein
MKKWIHLMLVLTVGLTGCLQHDKGERKRLVSVSIQPEKYFVQRIAGDGYEVNVLLPPGASPESFDPAPRQLENLENSIIYFRNGYFDFEGILSEKVASLYKHLVMVDLSNGIELIGRQEGFTTSHQLSGIDPHFWLAPEEVTVMAGNIRDALISFDPANKEIYTTNCRKFIDDLTRYDHRLDSLFSKVRIRKFIIYHPALTYLARDYHLGQYAIEQEGISSSPAHLTDIIIMAKEYGIHTIFIEKQFDSDLARTLSDEIGGTLATIDPLAYDWFRNMDTISTALFKALNP